MINYEVNDELKASLERLLAGKANVPENGSISIVQMEQGISGAKLSIEDNKSRNVDSTLYGGFLEGILDRAASGEIIVLVGDPKKTDMADSSEWQGVMGYPNVSYCEGLDLYKQLSASIDEAISQDRPKNEIAIDLALVDTPQSAIRGLKHVVERVASGAWSERMEDWQEDMVFFTS